MVYNNIGSKMKFDIKNKNYINYSVYLDGKVQKSAIEADDELGWVRTEKYIYMDHDMNYNSYTKIQYGKVHIVKMVDIPTEDYRDYFLMAKYCNY